MKRIEVILSQAIAVDFEEDYINLCKKERIKAKFTKIENVVGQGSSSPKLGNSIWPQLNSMFIVFCEDELSEKVASIICKINEKYPGEGASAFISDAMSLV